MKDLSPDASGWLRICVSTGPDTREAVGAFLFDLGCSGLVEEDEDISGYLPEPCDREEIMARLEAFTTRLKELFPWAGSVTQAVESVAEEDWAESWRAFFQPEQVSGNLLVVPAWLPPPSRQTGHVVFMDPGPAFGTGKHATTKLCLREIERLSAERPESSFLDVGTGSGILAIYAVKLGFSPVTGIDIDSEALRWASRNIALNGLEGLIELDGIRVEEISRKYTVVAANLILGEILKLLPHLVARTRDQGSLVISGILRDQIEAVESSLPPALAESLVVHAEGEWACLTVHVVRAEDRQ